MWVKRRLYRRKEGEARMVGRGSARAGACGVTSSLFPRWTHALERTVADLANALTTGRFRSQNHFPNYRLNSQPKSSRK
jgi:hypothetical protein